MAEKILKVLRQQKTGVGHLQFGVAYRFDMKNAEHAETVKHMLDNSFAEEVSEKDLAAAKESAEALATEPTEPAEPAEPAKGKAAKAKD